MRRNSGRSRGGRANHGNIRRLTDRSARRRAEILRLKLVGIIPSLPEPLLHNVVAVQCVVGDHHMGFGQRRGRTRRGPFQKLGVKPLVIHRALGLRAVHDGIVVGAGRGQRGQREHREHGHGEEVFCDHEKILLRLSWLGTGINADVPSSPVGEDKPLDRERRWANTALLARPGGFSRSKTRFADFQTRLTGDGRRLGRWEARRSPFGRFLKHRRIDSLTSPLKPTGRGGWRIVDLRAIECSRAVARAPRVRTR
ncbi:hypothetical protein [Lysobacter gummosus]|uniref:hypothetical protein n=1 Tax=Lysobacter gummosus TaxID=262324 RepID=UPI003644427D